MFIKKVQLFLNPSEKINQELLLKIKNKKLSSKIKTKKLILKNGQNFTTNNKKPKNCY